MAELTDPTDIRDAVRERYAARAARVAAGARSRRCCGACGSAAAARRVRSPTSRPRSSAPASTRDEDRDALPDAALLASLGCGNPTAVAELHEGETVLDLGSGGGIDVLLSARRVGPTGKAYGLDMTDEMLALARANQRKAGVDERRVRSRATSRRSRCPTSSVDVVISNCVINLSADKPAGPARGRPRPASPAAASPSPT